MTVTMVAPGAEPFGEPQRGDDVGARRGARRTGPPRGPAAGPWRSPRRSRPARSGRRGRCRQSGTTKPAPTPSILCAPGWPPDSTGDSAGSTATIADPARRACAAPRAMPRSDAAVPTLWTKPSIRPPVCVQISSRHRVIGRELVGVVQLIGPEGARVAPRSTRAASIMSRVSFSVMPPLSLAHDLQRARRETACGRAFPARRRPTSRCAADSP